MSRDAAGKIVFISHSSKDEVFVLKLAMAIEQTFREQVWVDLFDLAAGDELWPRIAGAIQTAKWFILVASRSSLGSRWVQYEANLATFMAIERDDFAIITIVIEDCSFPEPLGLELRRRKYIDARADHDRGIEEVLATLRGEGISGARTRRVFLDRGSEMDRIQLAAESAKIIYVVGFPGIGKTALVEEAARTRFFRPYIRIPLRAAHDTELLARQIIAGARAAPPTRVPRGSRDAEELLSRTALAALRASMTAQNTFLFLDDAESGMAESGELRPYLQDFTEKYVQDYPGFPLILAATRRPGLSVSQVAESEIVTVDPLSHDFMVACIQHWYSRGRGEGPELNRSDLDALVEQLGGGYPLAAKLIASYLLFESPEALKRKMFIKSFRLQVAEYLVGSLKPYLSNLQNLVLEATAIAETGVTVEDLTAIRLLQEWSLEEIQEAVANLARKLIVSQDADCLRLHPFLVAYFGNQADVNFHFHAIAVDLAENAWQKTQRTMRDLKSLPPDVIAANDPEFLRLNDRLLRYAASAKRLLLITGQARRAKSLPYKLSGHIREVAIVSYQRARSDIEYRKALKISDQWLRIEPDDVEIALYRARCLRRLRQYEEAKRQLRSLSITASSTDDKVLQSRIAREQGLIALSNNDLDSAIGHFESGFFCRDDGRPLYPTILVDWSAALIARADERGDSDPQKRTEFAEAAQRLEQARQYMPRFDQINLGLLVDALINSGDEDRARQLLDEALATMPEDPKLNLRKAVILARDPKDPAEVEEAIRCAEKACQKGIDIAHTVVGRLLIEQGRLDEGLRRLDQHHPTTRRDAMISDTIRARALSMQGRFEDARLLLEPYRDFDNTYVAYILAHNEYNAAQAALNDQKYLEAFDSVEKAHRMVTDALHRFPYHQSLFHGLADQIGRLRAKINKARR